MNDATRFPAPLPHGAVVLQATGLARRFAEGGLDVQVLSNVDLQVRMGETLAVIGA